jgi:hypothetical protein
LRRVSGIHAVNAPARPRPWWTQTGYRARAGRSPRAGPASPSARRRRRSRAPAPATPGATARSRPGRLLGRPAPPGLTLRARVRRRAGRRADRGLPSGTAHLGERRAQAILHRARRADEVGERPGRRRTLACTIANGCRPS